MSRLKIDGKLRDSISILESMYIPKQGERVEFASHFVPKSEKLLDVGCGNGVIVHFIGSNVKAVYGVDSSKRNLQIANKLGMKTKIVNLDKQKIPYPSNTFDVVTCLDVIEHVKDPRFLLASIYQIVKNKGILIISTPNIRFSDHLFTLFLKGKFPKTSIDASEYDGGHIHFFTFKDLRELLVNTGFKVIKEEGIINKVKRGWKGRLIEAIIGKSLMNEFRSPAMLIVAEKNE